MRRMTPEERFERIERTLELVVEQQARFQAQSESNQAGFEFRLTSLQEQTARNSTQIGQLAEFAQVSAGVMEALGRRMDELGRTMDEMGRRMDELGRRGEETDQRLNILIDVVERYFSNGSRGPL